MIGHVPWLEKPSSGMLEAFDVAVFTKDVRALPTLSKLIEGEEESLQRAAAIAFDRLSEAAPLEVMTQLNANPALMAERPFVRADYFSKADLSQAAQRHAVEQYLSRGDVSLPEKGKFLKASAAPTTFISDNLLTTPAPPPDDTARRQALSAATADWMKTGRFPELQPEITQLHRRLTGGR